MLILVNLHSFLNWFLVLICIALSMPFGYNEFIKSFKNIEEERREKAFFLT